MTIEEYSVKDPIEKYCQWNSIDVNENANKYLGPSGYFSFLLEDYMKELVNLLPKSVLKMHLNGYIYVHKLPYSLYIPYCTGHSISRLLKLGLKTPTISSKPARHFDTFVDHLANYLITLQHYFTGAQAVSTVEWYAGPFIKRDGLTIREIKQNVQRLLFNLNYPTRIGMQCLSQDTRILTPTGWKSYKDLKIGDLIYTFNIKSKKIEIKPVKQIAIYHYKGKMYNLKSKNQDQLISPNHRVVWLSIDNYEVVRFNPIEELLKINSPIPIPTPAYADNSTENYSISDDVVKLVAWFLSQGSIERVKQENTEYERIVLMQPSDHQLNDPSEIIELLSKLGFKYSIDDNPGLRNVRKLRLDQESSNKFFELIKTKEGELPVWLYRLSRRQARLFIDTYIKGNGLIEFRRGRVRRRRLFTTKPEIKDILTAIGILAGFNVLIREIVMDPSSKKKLYIITLTENKYEYIQEISEVDYEGIIWSVNTDNETVIAERRGCVFITGNTPFTNFTIVMNAPRKTIEANRAIYSGEEVETLVSYENEAKMFLKALSELYFEGDSIGQPFTFPIPTIMTTSSWIWDDPEIHDIIFKTTAVRGSFYWLNTRIVDPDSSFAMCCRLAINRNDLVYTSNNVYTLRKDFNEAREEFTKIIERQRFGGLWAVPDVTGSVNVTTINLPRLVLEARGCDDKFWELYDNVLEIVRISEEWFRERYLMLMSRYPGMYSMIKWYLSEFPNTHFNTIGLIGLPEAAAIYLQNPVLWKEGSRRDWIRAVSIMDKMIEYAVWKAREWMVETGIPWNVEEVPGESAAAKLAIIDSKIFPELLSYFDNPDNPIYSSSIAPYYGSLDLSDRIEIESMLQKKFTGGVMMHIFLDQEPDPEALAKLTKKLVETDLVYWSYTPAITHCNTCGKTFTGLYTECPVCKSNNVDVWSRIVGYYRPVRNWNPYRRREFWSRKHYKSI